MKGLWILSVGAVLTLATSDVLAFRDFAQSQQIERAMAAKRQAAQAQAALQRNNKERSVAGAKGEAGKLGPASARSAKPRLGHP